MTDKINTISATEITRRRFVRTGAVAVFSLPLAAGAEEGDAELHRLWGEYLERLRATAPLYAAFRASEDAFEAEWPDPELTASEEERERWRKARHAFCDAPEHKAAWGPWTEVVAKENRIREAIVATPAATIAGVGIKLAAVYGTQFEEDYHEVVEGVLVDIHRIAGTDFKAEAEEAEGEHA